MSYKTNSAQQLHIDDNINNLTKREQRILNKSWAKEFAERIFPMINENRFAVLYSGNDASRPNTPVNVIIGVLILKELFGMTDDEIMEELLFDVRYQYALHTTSFEEQPISDRTLSRFRARNYEHELKTGVDLIHETVTELAAEMAALMKINTRLQRMDSLMIAANIKKLSRLELLYTCVSNYVTYLHKTGCDEHLAGLEHYYDPTDYNRVIYHNRSTDTDDRVRQIITDARGLIEKNGDVCGDVEEYRTLARVMGEQTCTDENGALRLKTKHDGGMDSRMLQNPSDADATYREKDGKQYRGYVANITESTNGRASIVTDYQYEQNTYSDSQFLTDAINVMGKQPATKTIVADGAYDGAANAKRAETNNIKIVTTNLAGRKANDVHMDFKIDETVNSVTECAAGVKPKTCNHNSKTGQYRVSFHRDNCVNCVYKDACKPKIHKRTAVLTISGKTPERARLQQWMKTGDYQMFARFRNGIESVQSSLRRKYAVDGIPVRGKLRSKLFFGFKIAAVNFRKLVIYVNYLTRCNESPVNG